MLATIYTFWQFSKTAHFSDQKITNTWSKKTSWKRTLINAHYFSEHLLKVDYISSTYKVKFKPHVTNKQIPQLYLWYLLSFSANSFSKMKLKKSLSQLLPVDQKKKISLHLVWPKNKFFNPQFNVVAQTKEEWLKCGLFKVSKIYIHIQSD